MADPTEPGWRPEYTGDGSLGHVGSGRRMGAHLYYLYRAGRNELPATAAVYADLTSQVHLLTVWMKALFQRAGRGPGRAHLRLLELRDETHDILRLTCRRLQEVGVALVVTADAYARTDAAAAAEFADLLDDNADAYRGDPPHVPEPPGVHDPPRYRADDPTAPGDPAAWPDRPQVT